LFCFLYIVEAQNPQFKALTSLNAINHIKDILIPVIQPKIEGLQIPDVSGSSNTPIGITIDYDITNIVVSTFDFGPSSVSLNNGVVIQLSSVTSTLNMDWNYKASFIKGSGSATDSLTISITLILFLGESDGKPTVSVSSLSVDISSIDISLHGGESWFYQVMVDIFKNNVKNIVENALQSQLSQIIDQLANFYLKNTPTTYQINQNLEIDYSLVTNPEIYSTYSTTNHKGALEWIPNPSNCVFEAPILPEPLVPNKYFTFILSETMGDCIASILYMQDILDGTITASEIPKNSPIQLNTSDPNFLRIIPNLNNLYPKTAMSIEVYATETPDIIINASSNKLEALLIGNVRFQVQKNNTAEYIPVFTLGLTLHAFASLNISGNSVVGVIQQIKHNITLISTFIGPINLVGVDELISVFIGFGVEPLLNKILATGFPIPNFKGVQLLDSVVYYGNGYLQVGSDFEYVTKDLVDFLFLQN